MRCTLDIRSPDDLTGALVFSSHRHTVVDMFPFVESLSINAELKCEPSS